MTTAQTESKKRTYNFSFGTNSGPLGHYRYALYGVVDVYYIIETSTDNQTLLGWDVSACARPDDYFVSYEYSADGKFEIAPKNDITFIEGFYKDLPDPSSPEAPRGDFSGGIGTLASPYLISSAEEFFKINDHAGGYFRQIKDIDFQNIDVVNKNTGEWTKPVELYGGGYDGGKYKLSNYRIDITGTVGDYAIFRSAMNCSIENVIIDNIFIKIVSTVKTGAFSIGGLVAVAEYCTITRCAVINNSHLEFKTGISDSAANTNIVGAVNVGGIVGLALNGRGDRSSFVISECYVTSSYTDKCIIDVQRPVTAYVGGIVGNATAVTVTNSINDASIRHYNKQSIDNGNLGGIVGRAINCGVTNVISAGLYDRNSSYTRVGGIMGVNYAASNSASACYYLQSVTSGSYSTTSHGAGSNNTLAWTQVSTANFAKQATFSGFDFNNVWVMYATTPMLAWLP
jgi:hypothetical protein